MISQLENLADELDRLRVFDQVVPVEAAYPNDDGKTVTSD